MERDRIIAPRAARLNMADFFIRHSPFHELMEKIDQTVSSEGPQEAIRILLSDRNAAISTTYDGDEEETRRVLTEEKVIIVGNHQNLVEPLYLIAALPQRNTFSIIGIPGAANVFGESARKHIIPVSSASRCESRKKRDERRKKNDMRVDEAIQKLNDGEAVAVLPDGGDGTGRWKRGATRLIEAALSSDEIYLVMADIQGTTKMDIIHLLAKKRLQRTVRFSQPIKIESLPITGDIKNLPYEERLKQMAGILHGYYTDWQTSYL